MKSYFSSGISLATRARHITWAARERKVMVVEGKGMGGRERKKRAKGSEGVSAGRREKGNTSVWACESVGSGD